MLGHVTNELARTSGNDQINIIDKREHLVDFRPRVKQVYGVRGNFKERHERVAPDQGKRPIAVYGLRSSFQN